MVEQWEIDAGNAMKKMHRALDKSQINKDDANVEYQLLCEILDTAQQDYFLCDYGTYYRLVGTKMCGKGHDLATFKEEFPDLNPNQFWNPTCKLDPKEGCHGCRPKKPEIIEQLLVEHPELTNEEKDRIRELVDFQDLSERVVTKLQLPDPTPAGWPFDEE